VICYESQKLKEHERNYVTHDLELATVIHVGLLHPLPVPKWKRETISLNFIIGLPKTQKKNDSIMVLIDKLSKYEHFIPVKYTIKDINIVEIFMKEIFRLHGIP